MIELEGNGTSDDDAQLIAEMGIVGMTNESDAISTKNLSPVTGTFVKHEGESLSWTNVNMVVKEKGDTKDKQVLNNVWGSTNPGETTAILGPSGAGKTSLFNILAGRAVSKGKVSINANVSIGGVPIDTSDIKAIKDKIAYVAQEDTLHATSTPREAIRFSAKLRLPATIPDGEIDELVSGYIKELGLETCADTVIGQGLKKGISGGEKKRTSVGVELIVRPSIVLLDEPTSGLDSFSAEKVCKVLKKVAESGTAVLLTIHQPSSDIFMSFDNLLLINRGRVMYQGHLGDLVSDFSKFGYPIPSNFNPADWVLRIAQSKADDELENHGFYPEDSRPPPEASSAASAKNPTKHMERVGMYTELSMLFARETRSMTRNKVPMIANVCITAFLSLIYGTFFFGVGRLNRTTAFDVQAQLGAIVNILISTMMGQSQLALTSFPIERPLFLREFSTNHYSVLPYFLAKLSTEALTSFIAMIVQSVIVYFMIGLQLNFFTFFAINYALAMTSTAVAVFLGSALSDPAGANQFYSLVVVPQFYFSGVFSPIDLVPKIVRWAQYLCSLKYAAGLSMIYEFSSCDPGREQENCDTVLERNDVDPSKAWWFWVALFGLFLVFRLGALVLLRKRATDFS